MTITDFLEYLQRGRTILTVQFSGIPREFAHWKPAPDRWSATEIANHLADIESEDFRTDLDIILDRPEESWPSFDEIAWVDERGYNGRDYGESVARFAAERDRTLEWLSGLGNLPLDAAHSGSGGPRCFGGRPARAGDVLASWAAHDLFHQRQLVHLQWSLFDRPETPYSPAYSGYTE